MSRWGGGPGGGRGDGHTPKPSGSDGVPQLWGEWREKCTVQQGSGGWYLSGSCASQTYFTPRPPFHPHPLTQILEGLGTASLPKAADLLFDLMGKH